MLRATSQTLRAQSARAVTRQTSAAQYHVVTDAEDIKHHQLLVDTFKHEPLRSAINGRLVDVDPNAEMYSVPDAATGTELVKCQVAKPAEVDEAVASAAKAQAEWAKLTGTDRGRVLQKLAQKLTESNDTLAQFEAIDTARPIQETNCVDIVSARDCFEFYAGLAPAVNGEYVGMPGGSFSYTKQDPLGVTAGIGAWNYPIQSAGWKAAPSLAAGNAMLYKPAEDTPLTALALTRVSQEAGLPDGLLNVVLGPGSVGQMLTRHEGIKKVSFTGEAGTGKRICQDASVNLKKVTMELGGKSPLVVFADCDIDNAVSGAMMANFYSNGEVCSNGTRVFVHEDIYDEFVQKFTERVLNIKIGPPLNPESQMSALIHEKHLNNVLNYVDIGKKEGGNLLCGGERIDIGHGFENGYYMSPAVFADCTDNMTIVQEEIFGPVASVLKFSDEDEVVHRANDTKFGLSAGVFTSDIQRAHRVIGAIQAGACWINNYNLAPVEVPWAGHKESGIGSENGVTSISQWTQTKTVYVEMGKVESPF